MKRLVVLLAVCLWAVPASATTRYVATTGSNSNSCAASTSISTPKLTFSGASGALACMSGADTLRVLAGTYVETIVSGAIPKGTSWSAGAYTIVMADDAANQPILAPTSCGAGCEGIITFEGDQRYIEVNGLVLDGGSGAFGSNGVKISWSSGGSLSSDHIRLRNVRIHHVINALTNGMLVGGGNGTAANGSNEFINLEIDHNGINDNLTQGAYVDSSDNVFDGCYIHDNVNNGITFYNAYDAGLSNSGVNESTNRNVVKNSRFFNNGTGALGFATHLTLGCGDADQAYNNVLYKLGNATAYSLILDGFGCGSMGTPTSNAVIYNNTVYASDTGSTNFYVSTEATNAILRNNISYALGGAIPYFNGGTGTVQDHNLNIPSGSTNPQFTNIATNDYSITSSSTARDAGTTIGTFSTDIIGTARPQNGTWDIGAYEFIVSSGGGGGSPGSVYRWIRRVGCCALGGGGGGGGGSIAQVTTATGIDTWDGTSGTTIATNSWNLSSTNHVIAVGVRWEANVTLNCATGMTDTAGNTYADSGVGRLTLTGSGYMQVCYSKNSATSSSNVVTATFSAGTGYRTILAAEYSGTNASTPLDVTASGTASSSTTVTSGSFTPGTASSVAVAFWSHSPAEQGGATTADSNYTKRQSTIWSGNDELMVEDRLLAPTSAQTASATYGIVTWPGIIVVVFKP